MRLWREAKIRERSLRLFVSGVGDWVIVIVKGRRYVWGKEERSVWGGEGRRVRRLERQEERVNDTLKALGSEEERRKGKRGRRSEGKLRSRVCCFTEGSDRLSRRSRRGGSKFSIVVEGEGAGRV